MSQSTNSDTDQASILDQFADGDTLVDGYAGSRAGTGKTTRLVEWFRELHGDEAVRTLTLIDPKGDPRTDSGETVQIQPVAIDPRHATYKYCVSGGRGEPTDEEDTP